MGDSYPRFTVAAVQAASVFFERDKTIDKAVRLIEEAADKGAVIIGFPELFIAGHPDLWYHAKKSNPLHRQAGLFKQLVKNGVEIPGPETDRLCAAARKAHAFVVIGVSEVDSLFAGTLYISQLLISDGGEIMGVHRKMVSTITEKLIFSHGDGSYLNVYETPYGRLSAMVCGEHAHSLFKYALLAMGTQIHVAGWPAFPANVYGQTQCDSIDFRVRQFAHEGKIFVINACGIVDEQNIDICCDTQDEKDDIVGEGGGTTIIGPNGEYLAGPIYENEEVLTAEISLEDALPGKMVQNVLGHYTRWDVLSLNFNRERLSPFKNVSARDDGSPALSDGFKETSEVLREVREKVDELTEKLGELAQNKMEGQG
jgi:aliphatic nitrilase